MVEITKIECQRNKNKFNLFVDGQFYSGIMKETAIANNFFVGKKIDKATLDQIILDSQTKIAFEKASEYLATRLHSKNELKLKLLKKEFPLEAIEKALGRLQDYGYIDDLAFAQSFVQSNNKLSRQILVGKLLARGVCKSDIDAALNCLSDNAEFDNAVMQAEKYCKNKQEIDKQKLYAALRRKGFSHDVVSRAIKKVTLHDIDWE